MKCLAKSIYVCLSVIISMNAFGQAKVPAQIREELPKAYAPYLEKFEDYTVIIESPKDEPEWWAGAPSVLRDDKGVFWMASRMRTADAPRGLRGYEIRILKSADGIKFTQVHTIKREDVPIEGFERPVILQDETTGKYKLYACGPWGAASEWTIMKFDDAESPEKFKASTAKPVIAPRPKTYERDIRPDGYKDPTIIYTNGEYHCYVIGTMRRTERIYHFSSPDGENWEPVGSYFDSILDLTSWHDFYVRPASVVPMEIGYLFFYEGSNVEWYDPVYNMGTGVAFTFDLHTIQELTTEGPLAVSSTPSKRFHTFRYSHWMRVDDELWCYAEAVKPNDSHEVRLFRLKK
jgi:hypothetical protein